MPACPVCRYNVLLGVTGVASAVFLIVGFIFLAPYWLYDGASFFVVTWLGYNACKESTPEPLDDHEPAPKAAAPQAAPQSPLSKAQATWMLAAFSACVEVCFLIAALALWSKQMNPFAWAHYGRNGNSFVFCSIFSATTNCFVVVHFRLLAQKQLGGDVGASTVTTC